eukprot:superscaffoldBa00003412_g16877
MESVQLRRMWLQSCFLVVTTTETRDQDMTTLTCGDSTTSVPPHRAFPLGASHNARGGANMCLSSLTPEPDPNQ